MRVVMLANGPFALPTLKSIAASRHELPALVIRPAAAGRREGPVVDRAGQLARPAGGHIQGNEQNPLAIFARESGIEVLQPLSVNGPQAREQLRSLGADILVVCDYGEILSVETLEAARRGAINLHGSLLPKYRGAAPVAWAIYHGETETGVTVFQISRGVDDGACLAQERLQILPHETAGQLEARLAELGGPLVCRTLDRIERGEIRPVEQDSRFASRARKLKKTDGLIDWQRSARQIHNQVRAMQPWPAAYTFCPGRRGGPLRLIVLDAEACDRSGPASPGTVVSVAEDLEIAAGQGSVKLKRVQPAGGRVMPGEAFVRGHRLKPGDRLGIENG